MDIIELIKSRRTIHNYKQDPITQEDIIQAMELALWAPNHKNTFPWRFFRMGPQARKQLIEIAIQIEKEKLKDEFRPIKAEAIEKKFSSCPEIIVVARKFEAEVFTAKEDYASLACAIQNISLFLWQKGIGTKWSTGAVTKSPEILKLIQKGGEALELEGFLWIGYPEVIPKTPPKTTLDKIFFNID